MKAKNMYLKLSVALLFVSFITNNTWAQTKSVRGEFGGYGYNYEALKLYTTHGYPSTPVFMSFLANTGTNLARISAQGDQGWNFTGGDLFFQTYYNSSLNTRMYIKSNGNIGIGTTDPKAKLAVNGTFRCTEAKVMTNIQLADYVFNEDYKLRPLIEVEHYVQKNHHLPNIPSAQEVKENGMDVADFQNKLLEKIEVLTLYVIAQEKRIAALEAENKALQE